MKRLIGCRIALALMLLVVFNFLAAGQAYCQPGDPGGDSDVPIAGVAWLLIAGAIFGARAAFNKFKNK